MTGASVCDGSSLIRFGRLHSEPQTRVDNAPRSSFPVPRSCSRRRRSVATTSAGISVICPDSRSRVSCSWSCVDGCFAQHHHVRHVVEDEVIGRNVAWFSLIERHLDLPVDRLRSFWGAKTSGHAQRPCRPPILAPCRLPLQAAETKTGTE